MKDRLGETIENNAASLALVPPPEANHHHHQNTFIVTHMRVRMAGCGTPESQRVSIVSMLHVAYTNTTAAQHIATGPRANKPAEVFTQKDVPPRWEMVAGSDPAVRFARALSRDGDGDRLRPATPMMRAPSSSSSVAKALPPPMADAPARRPFDMTPVRGGLNFCSGLPRHATAA